MCGKAGAISRGFCFLVLLFVSPFQVAAQDSPRFFAALPDMPLAEGMTELADQTVAFDKPEGRIVESVARLENHSPGAIKKIYEETLPGLGWIRVADNAYVREGESLTLHFENLEGRNFLRILLRPQE